MRNPLVTNRNWFMKCFFLYFYFLIFRTAVALLGTDGVVFAVEKLVTSKLYEPGSNRRLFSVDRHIGMAIAGLLADARQIVETARNEASNYRSEYGGNAPLKVCTPIIST